MSVRTPKRPLPPPNIVVELFQVFYSPYIVLLEYCTNSGFLDITCIGSFQQNRNKLDIFISKSNFPGTYLFAENHLY